MDAHIESSCKKYVDGNNLGSGAQSDSKAAWGSIFKTSAHKTTNASRFV
jgi:hypothetical protein